MTRNGVWPGVFSPNSIGGLALNETTLPQLLKEHNYDTFMAGLSLFNSLKGLILS